MATAGRSVFFSGVTVAVSLAALIALPVPFLRSVGFTGLLIPVVSVLAALTLLPALLLTARAAAGLAAPAHRPTRRAGCGGGSARRSSGTAGGRRSRPRWCCWRWPPRCWDSGWASRPTPPSPPPAAPPAAAITRLDDSGIGAGLSTPVEILTADPAAARAAVAGVPGVAAAIISPAGGGRRLARSSSPGPAADTSTGAGGRRGARSARRPRRTGARVGGTPARTPTSSPPSTATRGG